MDLTNSDTVKGVMTPTFLLAFSSTHAAMAAQSALEGYSFAVIPTPKSITADCGISLRLSVADKNILLEALGTKGLLEESFALYVLDRELKEYILERG